MIVNVAVFIVQNVQNNGTLYVHVYFVKAGNSPNHADENYESGFTVYKSRRKSSATCTHTHTVV